MTTKQPYPEEFKIEAVKQITERGHRVADVSARIGVSQHSLYKWIKLYGQRALQLGDLGPRCSQLRSRHHSLSCAHGRQRAFSIQLAPREQQAGRNALLT